MKRTRREFLQTSLVTAGAASVGALLPGAARAWADEKAPKKLKVLFLGGTRFLGPHTVRPLMARGHEVTLFNRGKSNPHLFPELEKLVGDRYGDMSALEGRKWDAVIDTFAYVPRVVRASAELLKDSVKQYVLISTVSVYADEGKPDIDESYPLAKVEPEVVEKIKTHSEVLPYYGALKALCEQTAEEVMPGRVANIRPGLIVGPDDPSDRFTYWPVRVSQGGEVLCPNTPKDYMQIVDVRDLGEWIAMCVERNVVGVYNAVQPGGSLTAGRVVQTSKEVSGSDAKFTWVPTEFLEEQKVQPWGELPAWIPHKDDYAGFGQVSSKKAYAKGLKNRELKVTIKDTLDWWKEQPEERQKLRAGIKPDREKEVLAAWHAKEKSGGEG